jgi:glycosyltransferase involved in cell wall biosynthesis
MRLAYIVPRYGPEVLGGAETLAREVIKQLAHRGHHVEVWTTCARNTWANEYSIGVEQVDRITVRRFLVQPSRPYNLLAGPLTRERQHEWVNHQAHSPQLYGYINEHGTQFDFLIFMPYPMGTTLCGARIHPHKSLVWPCLHDELFAYLAPIRTLLMNAAGIIFNTASEHELMVKKLRIEHRHTAVVGMGLDALAGDKVAFRQKYPEVGEQFFIYAGRLEAGKNVDLLFRYFRQYQTQHGYKLDLVLLGDGPLNNGRKYPGIIPLGFVDETTKRNAMAAATFLCQPSLNESFSIVLMESWAQGRPVLVHEHCPVTLNHVRQAQGGLYFANYDDFVGAIGYLLTHPGQAKAMGASGQAYVRQNYNWPVVINRLEQTLLSWLESIH